MNKAPNISQYTWLELAAIVESQYQEIRELELKVVRISWLRDENDMLKSYIDRQQRRIERLRRWLKKYLLEAKELKKALDSSK